MKLTMDSKSLLEGLSIVTRALASKAPQPILEGVYFVAEKNRVTMTCSDGSFSIRWHGDCLTEEEGDAVLPGKLFAELVRKLPDGAVRMETAGNGVSIKCQKSRSKLSVIEGTEYPEVLEVHGFEATVPQAALKDMISHVSYAIATDESRIILTGGLLEITPDEARMVALDGFRLAMQKTHGEFALPDGKEKISAVIPGRVLNEMSKAMNRTDDDCVLTIGTGRMLCRFGAIEMNSALLAGEYIDYKRILPESFKTEVLVDVEAMLNAVDRASLMAKEGKNNLIKLSIAGDCVKISSNSEMGNMEEEIEVMTSGDGLDIAFNSNFIRDMLRNIDSEKAVMKFNAHTAPCIAMPQDNTDCLQLLLPVRTSA